MSENADSPKYAAIVPTTDGEAGAEREATLLRRGNSRSNVTLATAEAAPSATPRWVAILVATAVLAYFAGVGSTWTLVHAQSGSVSAPHGATSAHGESERNNSAATAHGASQRNASAHGSTAVARNSSDAQGALAKKESQLRGHRTEEEEKKEEEEKNQEVEEEVEEPECAIEGQDCRRSGCCKSQGATCFEQNATSAMCMDSCDWKAHSCKVLGKRTPIEVECTWAKEECSGQTMCCQRGWQCISKNATASFCAQVEQGPWVNKVPAKKLPVHAGWDGLIIGSGWHWERRVEPAAVGASVAGTTLFCFYAILPDSPEEALVQLAKERKVGIFDCDAHAVYHSSKSQFHTWEDTGDSTLVNTAAFLKVWDQVKEDGRYAMFDWTVKVDADCIVFPDRMRSHLHDLRVPADTSLYVKNTLIKFYPDGFLGAIEVLSRKATMTYIDNIQHCEKYIGTLSGEDGFMKDCMDSLGVGYMHDDRLMTPNEDPAVCHAGEFAAYHPFKVAEKWVPCYEIAAAKRVPSKIYPGMLMDFPADLRAKYS